MLISKVKKLNLQMLSWNPPPPLPLIVTETRNLKRNWTFLSLMLTKRQTSSTPKINSMGVCLCLQNLPIFITNQKTDLLYPKDKHHDIYAYSKIWSPPHHYSRIIKTPWIRLKIWPVNWLGRVMLYFKNDIGREYGW